MNGFNSRKGYSLAEVMLFSALAILIAGVATNFYVKGVVLTDETQKAVMVQQDVRAVIEYIVRDMNSGYWVLNPDGGHEHNLVIIKFASPNTEKRLIENLAGGEDHFDYPFSRAGSTVVNKIDAYQVTYEYDENETTVYRTEEKGIFNIGTNANTSTYATEYFFEAESTDGLMDRHPLAKNVKQFDIFYFGYERMVTDARGALKEVWNLKYIEDASDEVKIGMTACLLLKVMANFNDGVYKDGGNHRTPDAHIVTRVWSNQRLRDEVYNEYFSSVDWNLQF